MTPAILLVHGGLWEDMNADRFWIRPGVVAGLERNFRVLAPDRQRMPDWHAEARQLAAVLPPEPVPVVAGSNGCSAAVRLALALPERVSRLVLAWPATAGDPTVDARARADLAAAGASAEMVRDLLAGETLRGVADRELAALAMPVGVVPSVPDNPEHQRRTVDALLRTVPGAVELPGCPESPRPGFSAGVLVDSVTGFALP